MKNLNQKEYVATRNACKLCSPLGASLAFKGIEGCVPLIHGSQGCATYIRRYLISHFKEPIDIASTNFTEESAVFGGEPNLFRAIDNVTNQYNPKLICIATTCLSETIGDDMQKIIHHYKTRNKDNPGLPELVFVNTPSFKGTHADAFHNAVYALIKKYACFTKTSQSVNVFPGFLSPADLRQLKEIMERFELETILVPDYSDTLDYEYTGDYERIPKGGTSLDDIEKTGSSRASIEFGYIQNLLHGNRQTSGQHLENEFSVPRININMPIGINSTDALFKILEKISGKHTPEKYRKQRGRLVDSYVDGHKYVFGKKAVVYGEEDLVIAITGFLEEIGIETVLCASGGDSGQLKRTIQEKVNPRNNIEVHDNYDFEDIAAACGKIKPDILIGNSKGYYISRELNIPLVRIGFPIHDRMGSQRTKLIGYEGTQELFDRITNALIKYRQDHSPVGYKYM